jgi:peptide/nickel transport system substrate-binding protein
MKLISRIFADAKSSPIKFALVATPVVLFVFLAQSVFWTPSVDSISNFESRQDRVVFYMGGDPASMNPWASTTTTDSTIYLRLLEGLLDTNKDYKTVPHISEYGAIHHYLKAPLPADSTPEQFEQKLRDKYGDQVKVFKPYVEKDKDGKPKPVVAPKERYYDLVTFKELKTKPEDTVEYVTYLQRPVYEIELHAPIVKTANKDGDKPITSAIDPAFADHFYRPHETDGFTPSGAADPQLFNPQDDAAKAALAKLANGLMAAAAAVVVKHSPVVEMRFREGTYWTDGPFYSHPDETWLVTVNGDEVDPVTAESKEAAIELIRERHGLEDEKVEARNYDKRFGDDFSEGKQEGPWWGRGPEQSARDAKLTYDYIRNKDFRSPRMSSWTDITTVETFGADDKYKLRVHYGRLYSPATTNLTGSLIPYHRWNERNWVDEAIRRNRGPKDLAIDPKDFNPMKALPTDQRLFNHKPSCNGPFVLEPLNGPLTPLWLSAEKASMRRNDFFWGRQSEYTFLDYRIWDPALGGETSEISFLSGNMDIYSAKPHQIERYKELSDKYYVMKRESTRYEYIGFNCRKKINNQPNPMSDARVRLALTFAVDVGEIIKYVEYDQAKRISGPAYPVLPWYNTEYRREHTWLSGPKKGQTEKLQYIPFDLEEAKAILEEAGYIVDASGDRAHKETGDKFTIRLVNSSGGGSRNDVAILAKENWAKLGIKVEYEQYEWGVFIQQYVMPGNFDCLILGWSGGISFDKRQLFQSGKEPPLGLNFAGYSNKEADKLMDLILKEYDFKKQVELSHKIYELIADDLPYVFTYSSFTNSIMDKRIVWRKQEGVNADGSAIFVNRPIDHEYLKNSKASLGFFVTQLKRMKDKPEFTEADKKR